MNFGKLVNTFLLIILFSIGAWSQTYPSTYYPSVDEQSHWSVGYFGNAEMRYVYKKIRTSATTTVEKEVFYSMKFLKLYNGGTSYTVTPREEYTQEITDFYKECFGWYYVNGTNWKIFISFRLWQHGSFDILARWVGTWPSNHYDFKFVFDVDYDLDGASDDIVEYQTIKNNVPQWYASGNAIWTDHYDGTLTTEMYGTLDGNWLVRCADASAPSNQLQLFWGSVYDYNCRHDFYLRTYSSSSGVLQDVYNNSHYQQYAYGGRDQKMEIWIGSYGSTTTPDNTYYKSISGVLVQKPAGRSLEIHTNVMTGAQTPDLNLIVDDGRSVSMALNDLTNGKWTNYTKQNLSDPYTGNMTWNQLHDFMINCRRYSPVWIPYAQDNMRDWKVDVCVVNHLLSPSCMGVMFDYSSTATPLAGADRNNIHREGVAISWPSCISWHNQRPAWSAEKFLAFGFIHELGHCFNMLHQWSGCGEYFQSSNRELCPTEDRTIMTYAPMFLGSTTMNWSCNNLNWYQNGPKSWVKPGRLGTLWNDYYGSYENPPFFEPYNPYEVCE